MRLGNMLFILALWMFFIVDPAFAEAGAGVGAGGYGAAAAGIGMALAAFGGAAAQGKAVSAALESIGRNPGASGQMFIPMILGLAFIESLVIFTLVIASKLVGLF